MWGGASSRLCTGVARASQAESRLRRVVEALMPQTWGPGPGFDPGAGFGSGTDPCPSPCPDPGTHDLHTGHFLDVGFPADNTRLRTPGPGTHSPATHITYYLLLLLPLLLLLLAQ